MIRKYSKKGLEKRKEERKCLPDFFSFHIQKIKEEKLCCANCGEKLRGDVSEVAHVLSKQYFKSVMCNDLNVLYLGGMYSNCQCHSNFDNFPQEKVKQMNIYPKVQEIFKQIKEEITEKINYKHIDLYE